MSDFEKKTDSEQNHERNDEKYDDRSLHVKSPFSEKTENFWFHHKGKVIAGVVVVLLVLVTVLQMVGRRDTDVMIAYSGSVYFTGERQSEIQNLFSSVVEKEFNEDSFLITLMQYHVYSKEQIDSIRAVTYEDKDHGFVNSEQNSKNYEELYTYIMTGDTAILMLEPWLYKELVRNGRLRPMSELFETLPPSVDEEGYGIVFSETELCQYYNVLQEFPEGTVICFLKPQVIGKTSKEEAYTEMEKTFRAIVNFERPDEQ